MFLESDVSDTFPQNQLPNSSKIENLELHAGYVISKKYTMIVLEPNFYIIGGTCNNSTKISNGDKTELLYHSILNVI